MHGNKFQLGHVEIVYKDVVYNGLGQVVENPIHVLIPEAFPNKTFHVSNHVASGLLGYLKLFLPPFLSRSVNLRGQQILVLIGATGLIYSF